MNINKRKLIVSFDDWVGGWARLADALVLIFTLGQYNPRLTYKWYFSCVWRSQHVSL